MSFQPNTIYCGDCKEVLMHFPENCADLIYLDPPFFSNRHYEVLWGDGYELRAFADRWKGGINNYVAWMRERLQECYRVLKPTGTIYLHCDYHANAHLRVLMDQIFKDHFLNEIVWCYRGGGSPKRGFGRRHDTIYRYSKTDDYRFYPDSIRIPYQAEGIGRTDDAMWGKHKGTNKVYKPNPLGKIPEDWWLIDILNANDPERLGYPTQKPEILLERIINASSTVTEIVLDPFCGCGTAIAVAHKLGRRWIGIDVSPTACKLMANRMRTAGAKAFQLIGMPKTLAELKAIQPFEFQNWVMEKLYGRVSPKKVGDMGIDGYFLDGSPIQVKQSEDIGRNIVDNFETAMQRIGKRKGVIVAFSFGKGAYEEVARAKLEQGLEITLKTVEEILKET
jgi:DNA modification methylase